MKNTLPRLALTTAGLALGIVIANASPLQAATIQYEFDVNIDSGSLVMQTYSGSFSYDNLTAMLSAFSFSFDGLVYDETDDPLAMVAESGPNFLGLIYSVDGSPSNPSFSFVPGISDLGEAYFAYDPNSNLGVGGFGSIVYNNLNPPVAEPVPAPLPVMGAAAFFAYSRKLRMRIHCSSAFPSSNSSD